MGTCDGQKKDSAKIIWLYVVIIQPFSESQKDQEKYVFPEIFF